MGGNGVHLKASGEELVLHLQVVALVYFGLEGLVEDGIARVILNVLPAGVAVSVADQFVKGEKHNQTRSQILRKVSSHSFQGQRCCVSGFSVNVHSNRHAAEGKTKKKEEERL